MYSLTQSFRNIFFLATPHQTISKIIVSPPHFYITSGLLKSSTKINTDFIFPERSKKALTMISDFTFCNSSQLHIYFNYKYVFNSVNAMRPSIFAFTSTKVWLFFWQLTSNFKAINNLHFCLRKISWNISYILYYIW